jgi:very-short-patch-repair endonuclease
MLPHEEEEVRCAVSEAQSTVQIVVEAANDLVVRSGAQTPTCLSHVERSLNAAAVISRAASATETAVLLNAEWNTHNEVAELLVKDVEGCQRERTELARNFTAAAIDGELWRDIEELCPLARKPFRIFNRRYRVLRKELATSYSKEVPKTSQMILDLVRLAEHQRSRETLRNDASGSALFGHRWSAEVSDVAELRRFAEWVVSFRRELVSDALTAQAVAIAASPIDAADIALKIQRLRTSATALRDRLDALVGRVRFDPITAFGRPLTEIPFDQIAALLLMWTQKTSDLFRWAQFNAARKRVRGTAAALMEPLIVDDRLDDADVLPGFRLALSESLLRLAFGERTSLGRFVGDLHQKKIARFRQIDSDLVKLNQARLSRRLHDRRPLVTGGASRNSEVGILLGEFNRKRAHMAIRKLLSQAGSLIQRIKPCFLMSPLSIAQFLHPQGARFDLIVFDEASQVRPEDAVGALLRGGQLVVMGDTQQLPPTSFFDTLASEIDEGDEEDGPQSASVTDVESILHQCARSYPTKMLNWHYRSRHESLIAVSNLQFYDNQLHIYPSSIDQADEIGLHFVHMPQSVYDRGKSSTNRVEAKAVAMAAVDHYQRFPDKSLGVGAFNIKQHIAILEEIEVQLKAHQEMEPFFKSDRPEHFFVKNLETIQGDERDVILISVGYGRDVAGKLSLNFGPINREGGERRLNVLMSRARERCVVFSNFTAGDLPLEGSTSKGLQTLKMFLDYAQTRRLTIENLPQEDTDSPFEDAVAEVLRLHRYEVRQQVGCAGFRVDLAVIDPQERGRYLIGIECDGAKYHSSPVARDRDRLRQQILEKLGWTIHRIWSTDWYRNRAETIEHLLGAVEEVMRAPRKMLTQNSEPEPTYTSSFTADEYEEEYAIYDYTPTETVADVNVELNPKITVKPSMVGETEEAASETAASKFDDIAPYDVCRSLRISVVGELHELRPEHLALAVEDVVLVEAPVIVSEVIRRIRTIWGLQRAGNRIREAIERGIHLAVLRGVVERDGDFLLIPNTAIRLRRRNGDPPAHIELISDREIAEAIKHTLRMQFATGRADLVNAASRRLGIQATSGVVAARVGELVETGIARGWWRAQGDKIDIQR